MVAVSVGLPFLDAERTLAEAIRSVFSQTFDDWELLLVDDGSTDRSLEIARSVADPRVRVLSDGENRGLPARLNQIVAESRSDFVARVDADDLMHPERLKRQVRLLCERPFVDLVGTACFALDHADEVAGVIGSAPVRADPFQVLRQGLLPHATLLCRREWCVANRYNERFPRAEDRELYCRTLGSVRFEQIREPLYFVRYRKDERAMLQDYVRSSRDTRRIFMRHAPRLVGPFAVVPLVVESFAKEAVFRAVTAAGLQGGLVRSRGRPPTSEELDDARSALRRIRDTRVGGLDRPADW